MGRCNHLELEEVAAKAGSILERKCELNEVRSMWMRMIGEGGLCFRSFGCIGIVGLRFWQR